jgi:hypothetical protein
VTTIGFTALALGALSGFRHAFEPDHLAAVSTLVTERPGPVRAARLGAWWGLGHTLALAAVAGVLTVLDLTLPTRVEQAFEFAVALMLCALGVRAIRLGLRQGARGPSHPHAHWFGTHTHASPTSHVHVGAAALATRPLLIGIVHGLAGSGAVTALVMTALPTARRGSCTRYSSAWRPWPAWRSYRASPACGSAASCTRRGRQVDSPC